MTACVAGLYCSALVSLSANAALIDRGGGLIFDTTLNITWLQDANYFRTQRASNRNIAQEIINAVGSIADPSFGNYTLTLADFGPTAGDISWFGALAWVQQLSYFDNVANRTITGWRLPTALNEDGTGPCDGFSCTRSELGHLFFSDLGGQSVSGNIVSVDGVTLTNLQPSYWTSTSGPSPFDFNAFLFSMNGGAQGVSQKNYHLNAWAIHSGDVALSSVPIPAAFWLLASALGFLRANRRS